MNNDTVLMKGTYMSQSGVPLEFGMAEDTSGRIMVVFNEGRSRGIAALGLLTGMHLDGRMFYVTKDEVEDFKNNVVDQGVQWEVADKAGKRVTVPGTWAKAASGGKRQRKSRMSRKSRKSRKSSKSRKSRKSRKSSKSRRT